VPRSRRRNAPIGAVVLVGGCNRAGMKFNFKGDFAARFACFSELLLARQK
jgi:hypothetical protein